MELSESMLYEIKALFNGVNYGKITFAISPEKKTLDYTIEITGKMTVSYPEKSQEKHLTNN